MKFYFNSLVDYVRNYTLQKIPLKKKVENFNIQNIENEFQNLVKFIDNDSGHINYLIEGIDVLDRYSNIKPYEYNRIIINNKEEYINASPINIISNKYFISTQGPKRETIEDFWRMIDEHGCNVIIMLCNLIEGGKEKCANYWDIYNQMNNYSIKEVNQRQINEYTLIRDIKFINEIYEEKGVKQIHFIGWPDDGVPNTQNGRIFDIFFEIIKLTDKYRGNGPIVVHCSDGVGRTGTYISMYYLEKEIIQQINKVNIIKFSIFNLVRKLKEMRLFLVKTSSQYYFIYQFVYYLLTKYNI